MKVAAAAALFGTLALPGRAAPQGDATLASHAAPAESAAMRRSAERAARAFEQRRLRLLPNVPSSTGGPGDVIIGRYRYAAGEADDLKPPPAEPPEIGDARRSLLHALDSTARAMPRDAWVRSRLVWYAIEGGDTAAAVSAARACHDDELPWWCNALLGLALHAAHDFVTAERAFDQALVAMPDSIRCRWTDVTAVLDSDVERLFKRTPCAERPALDERLWWLADPFHSIEGNELRSEHLARHAFAVLHDRWRPSHPLGWGSDMREIVLRYAWPVAWSRDRAEERSPSPSGFSMALTGHEPNPAYDFFPDAAALESPYDARDESWNLKRPRATAHYAHPLAVPMRPLRHQIARFHRGDSLLVVAAWDARDDTLFNRVNGRVALVMSQSDRSAPIIARSDHASASGELRLTIPNADYLASLELFAGNSRAAARAREGVRSASLANGVAVSDILLIAPGEHPRTLEEALGRLLPDGHVGAERRVTLYWEVYGRGDTVLPRVAVTVSRVRASRARRLAEKLRLRDEPQTVEEWRGRPTRPPAARRRAASPSTFAIAQRERGAFPSPSPALAEPPPARRGISCSDSLGQKSTSRTSMRPEYLMCGHPLAIETASS